MADFGLVKSFDIDDGELDGLSAQEGFVLGYELADIDRLLERGEPISRPVHDANQDRIRKSCDDASIIEVPPNCPIEKGQYRLTWMQDDGSESWMQFEARP